MRARVKDDVFKLLYQCLAQVKYGGKIFLVDNLNDGSLSCGVHKNTDSQAYEIIPTPGQMLARFQHGHFMCDVGPLHGPDIPPLLTYLHFHSLKKTFLRKHHLLNNVQSHLQANITHTGPD